MGVSKAAKPLVKAQLLAAVNKPQTIHYQERDRSRKKFIVNESTHKESRYAIYNEAYSQLQPICSDKKFRRLLAAL